MVGTVAEYAIASYFFNRTMIRSNAKRERTQNSIYEICVRICYKIINGGGIAYLKHKSLTQLGVIKQKHPTPGMFNHQTAKARF